MRDHKAVERERERDESSQGNIEMIDLKAVCIYMERDKKTLEIHDISQGSRER